MERVAISDGTGTIDIRGGSPYGWAVESLLYLGGVAAVLDSTAYEGSIGRLVARAPSLPARPDLVASLRIALATGQLRRPLSATLAPLLGLLANGTYELTGPEKLAEADPWYVLAPEPDQPHWLYEERDDRYLVPTESWPPADTDRIGYYRAAIRTGHRPAAVLLHVASERRYSGYLLDGHHKIAAYEAEEVLPTVVRIARVDPPALTAADLREGFSPPARENRDFRRLVATLPNPA
ncbi:hypothetical protein [Amycolatopsis minnesotensis]|uniref:Uncharacterized protein n=1 Tax=Amycolatopsis minnesotensis TaxID=337894 RepID=A0ABN2SDJ9_9PSEU